MGVLCCKIWRIVTVDGLSFDRLSHFQYLMNRRLTNCRLTNSLLTNCGSPIYLRTKIRNWIDLNLRIRRRCVSNSFSVSSTLTHPRAPWTLAISFVRARETRPHLFSISPNFQYVVVRQSNGSNLIAHLLEVLDLGSRQLISWFKYWRKLMNWPRQLVSR
jgi:hypothetical protein